MFVYRFLQLLERLIISTPKDSWKEIIFLCKLLYICGLRKLKWKRRTAWPSSTDFAVKQRSPRKIFHCQPPNRITFRLNNLPILEFNSTSISYSHEIHSVEHSSVWKENFGNRKIPIFLKPWKFIGDLNRSIKQIFISAPFWSSRVKTTLKGYYLFSYFPV